MTMGVPKVSLTAHSNAKTYVSTMQSPAIARHKYAGSRPYYIPVVKEECFKAHVHDAHCQTWNPADFPWHMDVRHNLRERLKNMSDAELQKVALRALPFVEQFPATEYQKIKTRGVPQDPAKREALINILTEKQFEALRDVANHALTAEQLAVAPLSIGIISQRRRPRIQEALTTFVADEAKHSSVFERYMREKLGGEIRVNSDNVQKFDAFRHLARIMPAASVFLALSVETVGGSFFEFFADHSPEPLFKEMCTRIAKRDEIRHMAICRDLYNELYRRDAEKTPWRKRWEDFRNKMAMKAIAREVYGQQAAKDHYLMRATAILGLDPNDLLRYIAKRVQEEFSQIGHAASLPQFMNH